MMNFDGILAAAYLRDVSRVSEVYLQNWREEAVIWREEFHTNSFVNNL